MKIIDIDLDSLDRDEYLSLVQSLISYYYVMFDEYIELKIGGGNE